MEIWGLCPECDRWFYCAEWFEKSAPTPTCPVCASEPVGIENRAGGTRVDIVIDDTDSSSEAWLG